MDKMKKMIILLAATIAATSVSAQTVAESKTTDNWYIGVNAGLAAKTTHTAIFKNLNPIAGLIRTVGNKTFGEVRTEIKTVIIFATRIEGDDTWTAC